MANVARSYIYRSHAVVIWRLAWLDDQPRFSFGIDGNSYTRTFTTALAASVAADSAIDVLIEDGLAAVGDVRLPAGRPVEAGMECADA